MKILAYTAAATAVFLAGCTLEPRSNLESTTKSYVDVTTSFVDALKVDARLQLPTRRDAAVQFYLSEGPNAENINKASLDKSFANWVCAGTTSLRSQIEAAAYFRRHANTAQSVASAGKAGLSAQWKRAKEQLEAPLPGVEKPRETNAGNDFNACVTDTLKRLKFSGMAASDVSDESVLLAVPAAIAGTQELVKASAALLEGALRLFNELESRRRFTQFINTQHEPFLTVVQKNLDEAKLQSAWERRVSRALWRPYITFQRMLDLPVPSKGVPMPPAIVEQYQRHLNVLMVQIAEYDALKTTQSPAAVARDIVAAEATLYEIANNKDISLSDISQFLQELGSEVGQIKKDYEDVEKRAVAAWSVLSTLGGAR